MNTKPKYLIHSKLLQRIALIGTLAVGSTAFAIDPTTQALLDLLVKRGIIKQQDAVDLENQAAANAAAAQAQGGQPSGPAPAGAEAPTAANPPAKALPPPDIVAP